MVCSFTEKGQEVVGNERRDDHITVGAIVFAERGEFVKVELRHDSVLDWYHTDERGYGDEMCRFGIRFIAY